MKLLNPLDTSEEPKIYDTKEAAEFLTEGDYEAFVVMRRSPKSHKFLARLDKETTRHRFLVGTWQKAFWMIYSTPEVAKTRTIAEEMGLDITDTGPIAVHGEDDKQLFPLQPHEDIYAVNETRQLDETGNETD